MNISEIICTYSFPPEVKTRRLEVTLSKQIHDMYVTMTQYFLYDLGELNVFIRYILPSIYQAMTFCLIQT